MSDAATLDRGSDASLKTGRILDGVLFLAAGLIPLGEGGFQVACALAALMVIALRGRALLPEGRLAWGFVAVFGTWLGLGLATTFLTGHPVRTSSLNYVLMSFSLVLGVELVRFSDRQRLDRLAKGFLLGAGIAAALGVCQLVFGEFPGESLLSNGRVRSQRFIPGTRQLAATGILQHRLKMSEAWLVGIAVFCAFRAGGLGWTAFVAGSLGFLTLIGLTFSKAALGAAMIALLAFVTLTWASKLARLAYLGGAALLVLAVPIALRLGYQTTPTMPVPKGSLEVRPWLWSLAYDLFSESPVFGTGIGTYYGQAKPRVISGYDVHSFGAHQEWVTVAVETGVVGLVLFATAVVMGGVLLLRAYERSDGSERPLVVYALASMTAFASLGLVHDFLFNPTTALLFWAALGVGVGYKRGVVG